MASTSAFTRDAGEGLFIDGLAVPELLRAAVRAYTSSLGRGEGFLMCGQLEGRMTLAQTTQKCANPRLES